LVPQLPEIDLPKLGIGFGHQPQEREQTTPQGHANDSGSQLLRGEDQGKRDGATEQDQFAVPAQEEIVSMHDATNRDLPKRHR
jgi:hypothetical protein